MRIWKRRFRQNRASLPCIRRKDQTGMKVSSKVRHPRRDGPETIAGDRRRNRRYELQLEVRWKLLHRRRVLESGAGWTHDLSRRGILFEAGRMLPLGSHLEVVVSWPALLHGVKPMRLLAAGRVVRSDEVSTAIRMMQHEFRTAGSPDRVTSLAAARASTSLWNIHSSDDVMKLH